MFSLSRVDRLTLSDLVGNLCTITPSAQPERSMIGRAIASPVLDRVVKSSPLLHRQQLSLFEDPVSVIEVPTFVERSGVMVANLDKSLVLIIVDHLLHLSSQLVDHIVLTSDTRVRHVVLLPKTPKPVCRPWTLHHSRTSSGCTSLPYGPPGQGDGQG